VTKLLDVHVPCAVTSIVSSAFGGERFGFRLISARNSQGAVAMATQIVMDHNGDTRHTFDANDAKALLKAEERFKELTGNGFTAAVRNASGEPVVKRVFDPTAQETLFYPRLVGG
jgi:hypothetical protein